VISSLALLFYNVSLMSLRAILYRLGVVVLGAGKMVRNIVEKIYNQLKVERQWADIHLESGAKGSFFFWSFLHAI
jgi:hypothetical protein